MGRADLVRIACRGIGGGLLTSLLLVTSLLLAEPALAQTTAQVIPPAGMPTSPATAQHSADILWTLMTGALVFLMQAGFAMLEAGFTRAKNAANVMMKIIVTVSIAFCGFWFVGFGLMFGSNPSGWIGTNWFALGFDATTKLAAVPSNITLAPGVDAGWPFTFFFFQAVFVAAAAAIAAGALAERTRFLAYLIYAVVFCCLIYPIAGSWLWNGLFADWNGGTVGWLQKLGFIDFAGSTAVHSMGGWVALAGALVVGPRTGKYSRTGQARAIPGHNLPLGMLGVFLLWFGWLGFNGGSTNFANVDAGWIILNTNLSAAGGALGATFASWAIFSKPDMTFVGNGVLAGTVAITAPCHTVTPWAALLIGCIAGVLALLAALTVETVLKVDDPVGAFAVHGVCGLWGTLAAGIPWFGNPYFPARGWLQLGIQLVGISAIFLWAFGGGLFLFLILRRTVGVRVSVEEELAGLDISEHGNITYPDFTGIPGSNASTKAPLKP
ncbi:ammonium transporter [Leptolyngbya sp. FACHB-261]|uniref:ammonium transporter n=1 Tax=Leptolyngbya sp. FACHB-261 TaxID=2692806 RepID=UPI0016842199|nr:ammonium transporter [Leptolyngbya sp. FACHB-261]MBD2104761.1 ammonium transporter [Leptolyngbya sp. FACHB-261]